MNYDVQNQDEWGGVGLGGILWNSKALEFGLGIIFN